MSDATAAPDDGAEVDATGVDADFVTNDADPDIDPATPGEGQTADDGDEDDDEVDVSDLP
ncbi:hypothetical protein [Microbacterium sp. 3J1]|uniref:hypothetical protein n=1 Tax=Microbacterium sp. 3J1 TaxID=861269 RepID=UPI000ACA5E0B|nr:hypothetical protein [Microbacterium sp. 3J1]